MLVQRIREASLTPHNKAICDELENMNSTITGFLKKGAEGVAVGDLDSTIDMLFSSLSPHREALEIAAYKWDGNTKKGPKCWHEST